MVETTNVSPQAVALALFQRTTPLHALPDAARHWLQLALAAHAAAPDDPKVARDLLLAAPIDGVHAQGQCVAACAALWSGGKQRVGREPALLRLDKKHQRYAKRLAALVRLSRALADIPAAVEVNDHHLCIAAPKTDHPAIAAALEPWQKHIGKSELVADDSAVALALGDAPMLLLPAPAYGLPDRLRGEEPLTEGARRMLRHVFEKMLAREKKVHNGETPDDVHQMRVAIRKLRASMQIVEPFFAPGVLRRFRRKLSAVADALGGVRDYDVFLADIAARSGSADSADALALAPLTQAAHKQRTKARAALLQVLESESYGKLKHQFATFLCTPGADVADPGETSSQPRVRDGAGSLIWRRYEAWRAFEVALPNADDHTLHQARITGKRLRYTLEFFADVLGDEVDQLLDPLVALQTNLGDLQDGAVAHSHIAALGLGDDPGAQRYLDARTDNHASLLAALPALWHAVDNDEYRARLLGAIGTI